MDLPKLPAASPASTYCSELEYLINLQSEELCGSQLRRSQRLREREQATLEARKEISEIKRVNSIKTDGTGSPQLFVETDEEFSQLGQLAPKQDNITNTILNQDPQNVGRKRTNQETSLDDASKPKRRRKSLSKENNRFRSRKRTESIKKPTTLSSKLKLTTNPIKSQLGTLASHSNADNADWLHFYNSQAIAIPTDANSALLELNKSPIKQPESTQNPAKILQVQNPQKTEPEQKSHSCESSVLGTKRGRPKKKPETVPISDYGNVHNPRHYPGMSGQDSYQQPTVITLVPIRPHQPIPTISNVDGPQLAPGISWQHSYRKPGSTVTTNPPEPKPSTMITTNTSQTCAFQRINLTQTLLPDRYPPHFIHQLPPQSTTTNGVILSSELQRIGCGNAVQDSSKDPPPKELHQMCPTPDSTPTVAHESYSPSPPIAESVNSTSPSLSDSLAEVFGTRKIRNLLNIEPPRKYLVLEVHLPAIAFMLNVELGRLRAVLGMTQRFTLDQVQEMTPESRDVISIHSSSEAEDNEEMQP